MFLFVKNIIYWSLYKDRKAVIDQEVSNIMQLSSINVLILSFSWNYIMSYYLKFRQIFLWK